eukprot:EG_transcript_5340
MTLAGSLCGDARACSTLLELLDPAKRTTHASSSFSGADITIAFTSVPEPGPSCAVLALVCHHQSLSSLERLVNDTIPAHRELLDKAPFALVTVPKSSSPTPAGPDKATAFAELLQTVVGALAATEGFEGHLYVHDGPTGQLLQQTLGAALASPRLLLWSRRQQALTPRGTAMLHRAFWLFDADRDGELNDVELRSLAAAFYGRADEDDVVALKSLVTTASHGLSRSAFLSLCEALLAQDKVEEVWQMLHSTGLDSTGQPSGVKDLSWLHPKPDKHKVLYEPSPIAQRFLEELFLHGFPRKRPADPWPGWAVVPGGVPGPIADPWYPDRPAPVAPFRAGWDDAQADTFLAHWSYRCLADPETLIRYCYYWGYTGQAQDLVVPHGRGGPKHAAAKSVIQVLVLGGSKAGKTSLIQHLAGKRLPDLQIYRPTRRPLACITGKSFSEGEEKSRATVVYFELVDEDVNAFITDEKQMRTIDVVLMLYDGSDPYSFSYLQTKQRQMLACGTGRMPFIYVMTKCDLPRANQLGCRPQEFVRSLQLSWPPVFVSVAGDPRTTSGPLSNEIAMLAEFIVETARHPECATAMLEEESGEWRRLLPLAAVVALGAASLALWLVRRRGALR